MKRLAKIVQSATPSTGIQFRKNEYGSEGAREFLRDILAMANADVDGTRYIVVGIDIDERGRRTVKDIDSDDFDDNPSYVALAREYIEPPIHLEYQPVVIDGKRVGVYEIPDGRDKPYMIRIDQSEALRRGDAYTRANDRIVKMGRRQLQELFEQKFRESASDASIEIGFPGDIIHKDRMVPVCDLSQLPSSVAITKLEQLIAFKRRRRRTGSTSLLARLTHARLFGTDRPYEDRSPAELEQEMRQVRGRYQDQDEHFLFEKHAHKLQIVVYNQGAERIREASLSLVIPNHPAVHVASRLPKLRQNGRYIDRSSFEQADYPSVATDDDSVQVSGKLGDVPAGEVVEVFARQPRLCVGKELSGKRVGIRYSLAAKNLRTPAKGTLTLLF